MIHFEKLPETVRFSGFVENRKKEIPTGFLENSESYVISYNDLALGIASDLCRNETALVSLWLAKRKDHSYAKAALAALSEKVIRKYHPKEICVITDEEDSEIFESCGYHKEPDCYCREIEPWRYLLDDRVFDDDGMIINQGMMEKLPFGWFNTKDKGCGWISAYNLFHLTGRHESMQYCAESLGKGAILGELMGQEVLKLYLWLKKQGLPVQITLPSNTLAKKAILSSRCGIILYNHKQGAHYVTYQRKGKDQIRVYNAVYGKKGHIEKIDDFFKKYTLFPTSIVIYIK